MFGKQAAAALERARLHEWANRQAQEAEILSSIGRQVTTQAAQGNLDKLLDEVRKQVKHLMDVSNFMVTLVDPDTSLLDFRLNYEKNEPQPRQWRDPECGLIGYLIRENKPLWFPDGKEAAFRDENLISPCGQMSQCWLGVPLHIDGRGTIGAVVVQHYQNPRQYDESHQRLLEAIAKQVAGAIELVSQRERENAGNRRDQFLRVRMHLPDFLQENEDWFWQLLLKFVTDECGLRFNRAVIFLADGDEALLRGRSGVGQIS